MLDQRVVREELSSHGSVYGGLAPVDSGAGSLLRLISAFDFKDEDWESGPTASAYREVVASMPVTAREAIYGELLVEVDASHVDPGSILGFVIFEPHRRLVARAVQDYLSRRHCDVIDEFAGVREIMTVLADPHTANRGAVLAGLVLLCDRRINAIARTARQFLTPDDIRDFSRVQLTTVQRCTVEFCLEWLIELTRDYRRSAVEDLSCALMLMAVHDEHGMVEDESEVNYLVGFNAMRVKQFETFESYYTEVSPIFDYLRRFEGFEAPVASVVECWDAHKQEARRLRELTAA